MCASLPLALSLAFSRDRQRRRSSENTRIRNATAAQYAPTFCATKKRFPRSLPFDREPLASLAVLLSLSCTRPSHFSRLFAEFSNFPLSLSFSLSLSLVRVPAFLFPFDSYFLSLSLISFANFLADPISRNEREWTTRTYTRIRPRIVFDLLVLTYLVERATSELVSIGSIRASKNASRKSRHSRRGRDKETRIRPISSRRGIFSFPRKIERKWRPSFSTRFQRFINYSRSSRILFFQEYIFFLHPRVWNDFPRALLR